MPPRANKGSGSALTVQHSIAILGRNWPDRRRNHGKAKHNGSKYHQKSLTSRQVYYTVPWKGRGRRHSNHQLKHHSAPPLWFKSQRIHAWCFPCLRRSLPTVSSTACPCVTSIPQCRCSSGWVSHSPAAHPHAARAWHNGGLLLQTNTFGHAITEPLVVNWKPLLLVPCL